MLQKYVNNGKSRSDLTMHTEAPSIGVVVVIYNKKCTESVSFREIVTNDTLLVILMDNSTDSENRTFNREECSRVGCDYFSMDGNKGLAKAYNAAIKQIGSRIDYLMLLDDDTMVPKDVISQLHKAIVLHPSADIFVPFVLDQTALLSPNRRVSSLFFRYRKRPVSFTHKMSAINSGLVICLDSNNIEKPLFDDGMFLDCIDHDFILRRIRQGASFAIYPVEFRQNFFDQTSRDQKGLKQSAMIRFEHFAKDYRFFCKDCSLNMFISQVYLMYRMARLNMRFRTMDFGKVLKRIK